MCVWKDGGTFAAMNTRLRSILSWCDQRHIAQKYGFFRGCDPALEAHVTRIYHVMRRPEAVTDVDDEWLTRMERIIKKLD